MKIISWNVNGIRSAIKNGFGDFIRKEDADIYFFQEIKISEEELAKIPHPDGYHLVYYIPEKKGYAGLLIYSKEKPLKIIKGIEIEEFDTEARVVALEYEDFYAVNVYFPHSRRGLERISFKLNFNRSFEVFVEKLQCDKAVIIGGDFNVAHEEIDLAQPKSNMKNAGFTQEERKWFSDFLKKRQLTDTFRTFERGSGHYTWWSNFYNARSRNIGWRIDYFLVSKSLVKKIEKSYILPEVFGSDHAPIVLELSS